MRDCGAPVPDVTRLDAQIRERWPEARRLDAGETTRRFPGRSDLTAVWHLPAVATEEPGDLLVAVDADFPWSLPRIALPIAPEGITYPHIELDGTICAVPSSSVFELPVDVRHVEALLADAEDVLRKGRTNANYADFYAEAHSYWSLGEPARGDCWVLSEPPRNHALWFGASCGSSCVVGETRDCLKQWARNSGHRLSDVEPALVLHLESPLGPGDYPLTPRDLVTLVDRNGATALLRSAVTKWRQRASLLVLLSSVYEGQTTLLAAELPSPAQVLLPGAKTPGIPGFRPFAKGATTRLVALCQVPLRFRHWRATPIYREYLHHRTTGTAATALARRHVVIAGCGALGGQLAVLLAQAGVGTLTLLDDEQLDWRNVGRHVLDGMFVGKNKALALREVLLRRFPDASVHAFGRTWEQHLRLAPDAFEKPDLVVSATAEPASNRHLDKLSESGDAPPVVFGWMEPYAVSAHAVFRHSSGLGLEAITDACGRLLEPVVDRDSAPPLPREPACGAFYQPYSALSAMSCVSLVAELVVDALLDRLARSVIRTWVGAPEMFHENRLKITATWHSRVNKDGFFRRYERLIVEPMAV